MQADLRLCVRVWHVTFSHGPAHFLFISRSWYILTKKIILFISGLGICSLDFSPVNQSVSSWIAFAVLINVTPYLIAFSCGCILHKVTSSDMRRLNPKADFYSVCSACGILFIIPYYYANFQNHLGNYVNHTFNLSVTILYFSSSLTYIVTFLCFSCCLNFKFLNNYSKEGYSESDDNSVNLKRRTIRGTDRCTSENSDLSHSML